MRNHALVLLLALTAGSGALADRAPAQRVARPSVGSDVAGSDDALRVARREQARFERIRRSHLPWAWGGGSSGHCDERIGRFCMTHGDPDDETWKPPPEDEAVVAARDRLIARLAEAATAAPTEPWVAGQRVRYLVEAKRRDEAVSAAAGCRAAAWWCRALEGFALHTAGEAAAADSAFEAMLATMPEAERQAWTDPTILLDTCGRRAYHRADAAGRAEISARFWRLADPFAARPGHEIRSEHFSRHVWDRLQDRATSTEGIPWGSDLREIVLRFGWPSGWERVRDRPGREGPPPMVSHYPSSGGDLLPPCESLVGEPGDWDVENPRPRAVYALPLGDSTVRWIDGVEHQIARFRRGDSAVVVAAYRLPPDSFPAGAATEPALALLPMLGTAPARVTPLANGVPVGRVAAVAPDEPLLVMLEFTATAAGRAARIRRESRLPPLASDAIGLSDILLLEGDALPGSLEDAVEIARTGSVVTPGERVGVFWEVYGLPAERADSLAFTVSLVERRPGWLTRLGRRIGLLSEPTPVRVRWRERSDGGAALPRALSIAIPPELRPGEYVLELTAALPGREGLTVRRPVQVEDDR